MANKVAQTVNGQAPGSTYSGSAALLPFYLAMGYVYDDAAKAKITGSANAVNIVTGGNLVLNVNGVQVTTALAAADTPAAAATKIDTALGANGDAAIVSSKLEVTSNSTAAAPRTVEVVSGTGTVLANLGLTVGQKGTTDKLKNTRELPADDPTLASNREDPGDAFQFGTDAALGARVRKVYVDEPTDVDPKKLKLAGGEVVLIDGDNLTGATSVTFGGTAGTAFSVVNDNTIQVTTPAKAAGAYDVVVVKAAGNATLTAGVTYV
jgi:hypothetical protein